MRQATRSLLFLLGLAMVLAPAAHAQPEITYEVTVTNLTPGQILAPILVYTHTRDHHLFTLGAPASDGVAAMAEDADLSILLPELEGDPDVHDIALGNAPIMPGASATVEVTAQFPHNFVTVAQMLVTTNDAFFAISDRVPRGASKNPRNNRLTYYAYAYDAGSEANTETCATIPGPPCGNAHVRVTDGAEGFVHVHSGIHGVGDLDPAVWDWNNPVARITVTKMR